MEAVGNAQSEAEVTTASVESAADFTDIIGDIDFDDIFATASAAKESEPAKVAATAEEKLERESKKDEREQNREATRRQLLEHFGSQQFSYDKYRGDVALMLSMCPAIDAILDEGFEYVSNWLEPHKVMEEKPKEDAKESNEEQKNDESIAESEARSDPAVKPEPGVSSKTQAEQSKPPKAKGEVVVEVSDARVLSKQERASVADNVAVEAKLDEVVDTTVTLSVDKLEPADEPVAEVPESTMQEVSANEVQDTKPVVIREALASEADSDGVAETEPEQDASEINHEILEETVEIEDEEVVLDLSDMLEVEPQTEVETATEALSQASDLEEATPDHFEAWREIAKEEPTLDGLFITIADDLETNSVTAESDDEMVEAMFIAHHQDVADEELVLSSQSEVFAVYTAIRSTRKSVEALYTARTKEECKFYIEEIVESLSIVLRALGYDNPEVIVRDFLSTHSPEALKNLITELENSLRRTMVREIQQRRAGHAKNRHTRLSKFVGFIMQALSPNSGRVAESA